jgi:hypothetical protein
MLNLSPEQVQQIISRQRYLEQEILGSDLEGSSFVLETQGGIRLFYKKHLWEFLGLGEFADENERIESSQDLFGLTSKDNAK